MLCAVPALRTLRAALPRAEVVLVGLPWARAFVERYPAYLNGFREFPGYPGLPERTPQLERIPRFLAELQRERFDLALQLHGSGSFVNPLTVLFGATRTAGFFVRGDYCPDPDLFMPYPDEGLEIRRLLRLLEFLGMPPAGEELELPLGVADFQARVALEQIYGLRPGGYACIHPGASVPERRARPELFARVADRLAGRGLRVVLTGTADERPLTQAVARAAAAPAVDLAGQTPLGTLGALLQESRLLICNDTGVSHLAAALRVPSVVISTGNNPERWAPIDARRHRVLRLETEASPAEVMRRADELLREFPFPAPEPAGGRPRTGGTAGRGETPAPREGRLLEPAGRGLRAAFAKGRPWGDFAS